MPGIWGGLYFLIFLLGIMAAIRWYLQNDGDDPGLGGRGIYAMKKDRTKKNRQPVKPPFAPRG